MVGNLAVSLEKQKQSSSQWFKELRNQMVGSIEKIDSSNFKEKQWNRDQGLSLEICRRAGLKRLQTVCTYSVSIVSVKVTHHDVQTCFTIH